MQQPSVRAYDEVVFFLAQGPTRAEIASFQLSEETLQRVRLLLSKKSDGALTSEEQDELDQCVQLDRLMTLIRSQARQGLQGNVGA